MRRILFVFLVWILAACTQLVPPAEPTAQRSVLIVSTALPREELSPVPTWRLLFPPTHTATPVPPTVTATGTPSPTPDGPFCLELVEPAAAAPLSKDMASLTWEKVPKAASYVLLLSSPDGFQEKLLTPTTGMELDIRARDEPVSYRWSVQAYDSSSQLLCNSNTFTLTVLPVSASALTGTPGTPAATATGQ